MPGKDDSELVPAMWSKQLCVKHVLELDSAALQWAFWCWQSVRGALSVDEILNSADDPGMLECAIAANRDAKFCDVKFRRLE